MDSQSKILTHTRRAIEFRKRLSQRVVVGRREEKLSERARRNRNIR